MEGTAPRPARIEIVEVGPRDGLQNEPGVLPTAVKVELIRRLASAGCRRIEAVSFARPDRVPQMADAEAVMAGVRDLAGVSLSGLVLNARGFERARAAGVREVTFVVVVSETFSRRNQGASTERSLADWAAVSAAAAREGMRRNAILAAAFGCPFEGEVPVERLAEVAREAAGAGADELALADTIGVAGPAEVEARIAAVRAEAPGVPLRVHFHNTRNTGYANADAAIRAGVAVLDAAVGGLGGCPFAPGATGNIATEDLGYLAARCGLVTGLDLPALRATTRWLEEVMGRRLPAQGAHVAPFPVV